MRPSTFTYMVAVYALQTKAEAYFQNSTSNILTGANEQSMTEASTGDSISLEPVSFHYETDYLTKNDTTTKLLTVCSQSDCLTTKVATTSTTVITTVDGILTVYVTAPPLPSIIIDEPESSASLSHVDISKATASESQPEDFENTFQTFQSTIIVTNSICISSEAENYVGDVQSTLLTFTQCDAMYKCSAMSIATGISYYTTTVNNTETFFTTICPLSESKSSLIESASSNAPCENANDINSSKSVSSVNSVSTSDVITSNTIIHPSESASTGQSVHYAMTTGIVISHAAGAVRVLPVFILFPILLII